jgi:tetratricopeptide (TPR) repeat protein
VTAVAVLAVLGVLASIDGDAPIVGDCARDPDELAVRATEIVGAAPEPVPSDLSRARELLRAARRARRSAELDLRASDLAFAAGDLEEGGDLLASAAESDPRAALSAGEIALLARRAEERRRWREAIALYDTLRRTLAAEGELPPWITPKIRELELEVRAAAIAAPPAVPPVEARLAVADGRRALARGELGAARDKFLFALRLSPGYGDALLALSAVETRAGRPDAAIRAARDALAAEPESVEAMTALATLLWSEPDRRAKEEAATLFDRAAARRPGEPQLLRTAAERYAELGDAPRALERLDRYLAKASPREREEVAPLRAALARGVRRPTATAGTGEAVAAEPASEAVDRWRKAQVLAESGDFESLAAALDLLAEAERLDPVFAQAPELAASIYRRRGEQAQAEAALRRAIAIDPSRPAPREELARLYDEDPAPQRRSDAARAWREAADAGSTEAVYELARMAEETGRSADALALYRRYRAESPSGLHAERAAASIARLEAARTRLRVAVSVGAFALLAAVGAAMYRRKSGRTLEEWLADHPGRVHRVRPIVGRLRHETLKHGGLLLPDVATRLGDDDAEVRRDAATHVSERLFGLAGANMRAPGLVGEARNAMRELSALAREDGTPLNLERRDPVFSQVVLGLRDLDRARPLLARTARPDEDSRRPAARAAKLLNEAARRFGEASKAGIERVLDRASALPVRVDALQDLLARVAREAGLSVPKLELLGALREGHRGDGEGLPSVRFAPLDWETLWRNLFSNALTAGRARSGGAAPVRLGVYAEKRRDEATGESRLRLVLADDLPEVSSDALRARPSERGWGVIGEILRRNDATFDIVPEPARGFTKGIGLDLSAIEGSS